MFMHEGRGVHANAFAGSSPEGPRVQPVANPYCNAPIKALPCMGLLPRLSAHRPCTMLPVCLSTCAPAMHHAVHLLLLQVDWNLQALSRNGLYFPALYHLGLVLYLLGRTAGEQREGAFAF